MADYISGNSANNSLGTPLIATEDVGNHYVAGALKNVTGIASRCNIRGKDVNPELYVI